MKNTITTLTFAIVLMFGATFANAGILIGDRAEQACPAATEETKATDGILIGDFAATIVVHAITGILIGDRAESAPPCEERNGILIGDRTGILIGD